MKSRITLMLICATLFFACKNSSSEKPALKEEQPAKENVAKMRSEEPIYEIRTNMGTIKIKLYKETPLHRDNFHKLVSQKYYDGLQFHRVIRDFMIQTGDPASKDPAAYAQYGKGGPGYTIPAEIFPMFTHKKGALAAARKGDKANPNRESSGSQFYIVHNPETCAQLDGQYTIFGETIEGFDVIDKIATVTTGEKKADLPNNPVIIESITDITPEQPAEEGEQNESSENNEAA